MTSTEIQIGEYARTKEGYIAKCIEKSEICLDFDNYIREDYGEKWCDLYSVCVSEEITKHSFNLIDLIEEGDYVNGHLVVDVDNINTGVMREVYCEDDKDMGLWNEDIKAIVTREQFETMQYKVGGEND